MVEKKYLRTYAPNKIFMKRPVPGFLFVLFLLVKSAYAQTDSVCNLRISILTCSPGQELYSLFGHSALRITDLDAKTDIIYNWGTFEGYGDPDFYIKFMRGKLRYYVSPDKLNDFMYEYQYDGRSVIEQVLALSCEDKRKIKNAVDSNMLPDNRYYKYDFTLDNCTTRIRDLIENNSSSLKLPKHIVKDGTTFRNMLHSYLDKGSQPWSKLGIDILLGARLDNKVTANEALFLPEYLMTAMDSTTQNNKPIIQSSNLLLNAQPYEEMKGIYEPLIMFTSICLLFFLISLSKNAVAVKITHLIDTMLLYTTGLIGMLLLFMWFFTDHAACANNYNLLWALPTNFIVAFAWKRPAWTKQYFKFMAGISILTVVSWFLLPQQLNIALLPLEIYMLYRYAKLFSAKNRL